MDRFLSELEAEFSHVEGDVNEKVKAWLSEVSSKVQAFAKVAHDMPHEAAVGLEMAVDNLTRSAESIGKHGSRVDGRGNRDAYPVNDN